MKLNQSNCPGVEGEISGRQHANQIMNKNVKLKCLERCYRRRISVFVLIVCTSPCHRWQAVFMSSPCMLSTPLCEWHFHDLWHDNRGLLACEMGCCDICVRKASPVKPCWRIVRFKRGHESGMRRGRSAEMTWQWWKIGLASRGTVTGAGGLEDMAYFVHDIDWAPVYRPF